jgi:2-polyprenyl-3-methyl-5-hydroxy-6-metoxy-1,4-benzoquinol methylase
MDGRPYVATEAEPYVQFWLTERYRILHALFSAPRGAVVGAAIEDYCRLTRTPPDGPARARLLRVIDDMRSATVLVGSAEDPSRYTSRIVDDYVTHRPFPAGLATHLVDRAAIGRDTRVLDLAGGPGDLALALARVSNHVSLMDLSRGFLQAAARRARQRALALTTIHESCNRLVYRDDDYDVIAISQALHWLDDVLVARGVSRILAPDGSFFVIHSSIEVADEHPLAMVLGRESVLGHKADVSFASEVEAIRTRLERLFLAVDAPHRSAIVPVAASLFRQPRPFGLGYVRGFLTDAHITGAGREPKAFWQEVVARASAADRSALAGIQHWAVLQFTRGGHRMSGTALGAPVVDIDFDGEGQHALAAAAGA